MHIQLSSASASSTLAASRNKVLRNTYWLLALSLLPTLAGALISFIHPGICLANADSALEEAFSTLDGRQVNDQRISVYRLASLKEAAGCQVFYLQQGGAPISLHQLSRRNPGLLTIGDDENFLQQGGIIQLVEEQNRLQFDINLTQLQQADFNISAQLLKLARNARSSAQ